jgi:hypothetical protein
VFVRNADHNPYAVELALVTIENVGRTAVTVAEVGLDVGTSGPLQRHRYTVAGLAVPHSDLLTTSGPVRVEPFAECQFLFDVWLVVESGRGRVFRRDKVVRVRAGAQVAGRRLRRRSSRWQSWVMRPGQESLTPHHVPSVSEVIYRIAWRHLRRVDECADPFAHTIAQDVTPLFEDGCRPTKSELRATVGNALERRDPPMPPDSLVRDLLQAFDGT